MSETSRDWDVIVIGSGLGGLTCAGWLSKHGKRVLVLERHSKVGGYAHKFKRKAGPDVKYHFDVALHVTGAMDEGGSSRRILEEIGVWDRIEVERLDTMYRSSFPDFEIQVPADKELFRQKLIAEFPEETKGIDSLFSTIGAFESEVSALQKAAVPGEPPASDFAEKYPTVSRYMVATLHDFVAEHVTNDRVAAVFCQLWPYIGLPPKRASAFLYLQMWISFFTGGAYYIQGGGYALSTALRDVVKERGGAVLTRTAATRVCVEGGRCVGVETANGDRFNAPVIVSNAAAPLTFEKLIDPSVVDPAYLEQVKSGEVSVSIIQAYIGVKGTPEEIGFVDHEYFVNTEYDADANFDRVCAGDYAQAMFLMANNTCVNPGDTPPGRSILEIAIFAEGMRWFGLSEEEYKRKKSEVTELLIDRFSEIVPDIRERIEVIEVGTPRTMERYTGNPNGAVYGYASTPMGHSVFRPNPETPAPGLYLASAWTFPGPGFGGVMVGGMNTARIILSKQA